MLNESFLHDKFNLDRTYNANRTIFKRKIKIKNG